MYKEKNITNFVDGVLIMIIKLIRLINRVLLKISFLLKITFVLGFPTGIMIEPASICNLKCPLCPAGINKLKRKKSIMSFDEFKNALGWLKYTTEYITFWNFGEPLLNNELYKMIEYCHKYYINTQISTNGLLFNDKNIEMIMNSNLNNLIISIDTYDENIYDDYRVNGNYLLLINNIKKIVKYKQKYNSNTKVTLQYMIMNDNENIEKMKQQAYELGVDEILIKTVGIGTSIEINDFTLSFLPKNPKYRRYNSKNDIKLKNINCKYVWYRMLLCSDLSVLPCCRDQNSEYILGYCDTGTKLSKIWNSKMYRKFRKEIKRNMIKMNMCQKCPENIKSSIEPGNFYSNGMAKKNKFKL